MDPNIKGSRIKGQKIEKYDYLENPCLRSEIQIDHLPIQMIQHPTTTPSLPPLHQLHRGDKVKRKLQRLLDSRSRALGAKASHSEAEKKYIDLLREIDTSDPDIPMTRKQKDLLSESRDCHKKTQGDLDQCVKELCGLMDPMYLDYLELLWKKLPMCFAEPLLGICDKSWIRPVTMTQILGYGTFVRTFDPTRSLGLITETQSKTMHLIEPVTEFKSSALVGYHVGSGTKIGGKYQIIAFMTLSGSVYQCLGESLDPGSHQSLEEGSLVRLSDYGYGCAVSLNPQEE